MKDSLSDGNGKIMSKILSNCKFHVINFQGRKCTETKSEQSPWWTVDLLSVQVTKTNL